MGSVDAEEIAGIPRHQLAPLVTGAGAEEFWVGVEGGLMEPVLPLLPEPLLPEETEGDWPVPETAPPAAGA